MKKIISLMLVIVLLLSAVPCASAQSGPFSDVPKSHWAYASIVRAYEEGAVKGVGSGKFAPNRNITLAELTAIIIRIMYPEEVKTAETQIVKGSDLTGREYVPLFKCTGEAAEKQHKKAH
ncbi:MAG: S-layer homology domain-containing protein, partial [Oscillospiraceae bacterium]|nr:S-layer homology domain-containing protein [Oscillospiraceae bacterium]